MEHLNSKGNTKIANAIKCFGVINFIFEVIEEVFVLDLNERERYWINYHDSYKNGYNSQ